MSEYKRPETETEFHKNFAQIHPLMNDTEVVYESARCLFCYDAPCVTACPTAIDIPLFIRQINTGNITGAAKTIYSANYLGNTCGKVCPTEVLCEGACVYIHQDVKPIEIGRLQNYATDSAIRNGKELFENAPKNNKRVAVIGAGPGGISCACELSILGYEVTIFEAKPEPSGLVLHGVAPYKITNKESLEEVVYLQKQFGFDIQYNENIESKSQLEKLENDFDAIYLGIGLSNTKNLNIPGEDLKNCFGATEFIAHLKLDFQEVIIGKNVIVLGGGNTAMDAASESARMGAENVYLAYRRDANEMGAYDFEYELAKSVGVKGLFNIAPIEIIGIGKVAGVRFIKTQVVNGRLETIKSSEFVMECDMVIRATGQQKQSGLLEMIDGLVLADNGTIGVAENGQSGKTKYFTGGDAVNGGAEVVNAVAEGKRAATGIHDWLESKRGW